MNTREGLLAPDSSPERCNTLYLAGKACEKEYEQNARTPFVFRQVKPALWKTPLGGFFPRLNCKVGGFCFLLLKIFSFRL